VDALAAWWLGKREGLDLTYDLVGQRALSPPSLPRTPRNFDEVISCFANMPKDTPLFSEARNSLYSEDDSKVRV
jgi:hypothetical protein